MNIARVLKFQSNMPTTFWGRYIEAAVYLMNGLPSSIIIERYPCELLSSDIPSLYYLRVFNCLCYAIVVPKGDKF